MQRFIEYINDIDKNNRVLIIHDIDLDGVVSCFLTKKALEKQGITNIRTKYHRNSEKKFIPEDYDYIIKENIDKVITVDLSTDEDPGILRMIEEKAEILIIDHHPLLNDVESSRTHVIKASQISNINPGQYPASKMVYDLFNQIISMKMFAWISCLGIKADSADRTWKGFIESNVRNHEDFEEAERLLTYACISRDSGGIEDAFNALNTSHNYKDIIKKLDKYKIIDKEVKMYLDNIDNYCECIDSKDVCFVTVNSSYFIKSIIANEISKRDVHKTYLILQEVDDMIHVAARRQDEKIDVGMLMKKVSKYIPNASGGGHKAAAGARFNKKHLHEFKKLILKLVNSV